MEQNMNRGTAQLNSEQLPIKKSIDWKAIFIIVVIALAGTMACGGYYFLNFGDNRISIWPIMSTESPVVVQPPTLAMSGWNVYRNERLGLEIQYLENWQYLEETSSVMFLNDPEYYEYGGAAFPGHRPKQFVSLVVHATSETLDNYVAKDLERIRKNPCHLLSSYLFNLVSNYSLPFIEKNSKRRVFKHK